MLKKLFTVWADFYLGQLKKFVKKFGMDHEIKGLLHDETKFTKNGNVLHWLSTMSLCQWWVNLADQLDF